MVVSSLTVTAKAEIIDNTSSNSFNTESINVFDNENIDEINDEDIPFEIEERREEFTKHFRLENGKNVAVTYEDAVFYYEEISGKYVEIDNRLKEEEKRITNRGNDILKRPLKAPKKENVVFGNPMTLDELKNNLNANCIPLSIKEWDYTQYLDSFLPQRRKLMAAKIKEYYYSL